MIERYVFRLGNLLNIVEKVTGIDYSCYDIPRTPKVWNVLARNWLQFIQVRNLKWKTYKLETSQSPEYSERKYCLLLFFILAEYVILVPDGDDDDYDDDDDYSRVCGENSRCPWKNCAVQSFASFQNRAVSTAQRLAASWVNCYIKDYTRWSVKFFQRSFSSYNFRLFFATKSWCSRWVDSWEKQYFL